MSITVNIPAFLDRFGSMVFQGRDTSVKTIAFPADGDVSGAALFFEVEGALRVPLGPAPATANFAASIAGYVLTVISISAGAISIGDTVIGSGVTLGSVVEAFLTGNGGAGTYALSLPSTLGAGPLYTADNTIRTLQLDEAQLAALPLQTDPAIVVSVPYVIRNDDSGSTPLFGTVCVNGYTTQPPDGPA